ncbi:MAG TPA: substrate-binding domain-containing protein [Tepidisphaeraceae bacterium]
MSVFHFGGVILDGLAATISQARRAHFGFRAPSMRGVRRSIDFDPSLRNEMSAAEMEHGRIGLLVLGTDGATPTPGFFRLLKGVTEAAEEHGLSLAFSFVSDLSQLPRKISEAKLDGVLLHGELPSAAMQRQLRQTPSVWLMANRQRPTWGDQVMPENIVIGEMAASYLISRGHRRLAYLGVGSTSWYAGVRMLSFRNAAEERGASTVALTVPEGRSERLWQGHIHPDIIESLVGRVFQMAPKTTGLFVAEDRMLPAFYRSLWEHGISVGENGVEIISCNYEQQHLLNLRPAPASIDNRPDAIGRCGVERLLWRMAHPDSLERIKLMIEPVLVEAPRMVLREPSL